MNTCPLTFRGLTVKFSNIYETNRNGSTIAKAINLNLKTEHRAHALQNATYEHSCCSVLHVNKLWDAWLHIQASKTAIIFMIS